MAENTSLIRRAASAIARDIKQAANVIFPGSYGGGYGGGSGGNYRSLFDLSNFFAGFYSGSNTNFQLRLGDPTASSPLATVFNWVGKRAPEASVRVIEVDNEDNEKPIVGHPLTELMRRPNQFIDAGTLWKYYALNWCLDGNVYWWVTFNRLGQPAEIWPLPFWQVWPRWSSENSYIDVYEFQVNGVSQFIPPISDTQSDLMLGRIMHFQDGIDTFNYRVGMSPLKSLYRPAFTSGNLDNYAAALSVNMGVPPLLISFEQIIAGFEGKDGRDKLERLQDEIQRRISGDNVGKPLVMTYPMKAEKLGFSPNEMGVRELDFRNQEQVAAVYGIPIEALGFSAGNEHSAYNNKETAFREAVRGYMVPFWNARDQALESKMLPWFKSGAKNLRVKFDEATVYALREDEDKKWARVGKAVKDSMLKVKDAQMMLGWKPDPQMDCYLRPQGLVEIRDGEPVQKPISPLEQAQLEMQKEQFAAKPKPGEQNDAFGVAGRAPKNDPNKKSRLEIPLEYWPKESSLKSAGGHKYGIVMANIVGEAARSLMKMGAAIPDEDLEVETEKGRETEPHITILYGLHGDDGEPIKEFVQKFGSISVKYGRTDYFECPGFDVVTVKVESSDLVELNSLLKANFEHTAKWPSYSPHATIAYVKSGLGKRYAGDASLLGFQDRFDAVTFRSKTGLNTVIPLQIEAPVKTAREQEVGTDEEALAWAERNLPDEFQGLLSAEEVE